MSRFKIKLMAIVFLIDCPMVMTEIIGQLPAAITNNAVAVAQTSRGLALYSFNGLGQAKDWQAVSNNAFAFNLNTKESSAISQVPFEQGRLASIAVSVNNQVYLFGGYTVASNHEEKSMSDVYRFDPEAKTFSLFTHMPIPVDDTVALVYQDRYIYLISGWHDVGNVADVQVLDTLSKKWFFATPYPGASVFGHAAGIVDNQLVVVDGVKVVGFKNNQRQFELSKSAFQGEIDAEDITQIKWRKLAAHPGQAGYRMAAVGVKSHGKIYFSGGSSNPYNYNGVGYNGIASEPLQQLLAFNVKTGLWETLQKKSLATMDHRGLLFANGQLITLGGMVAGQVVTDKIISIKF
jgi:N-acetylneuraminic acid mutarotase